MPEKSPFLILIRWFFHLLYHPFAWAYDAVSWTVSAGRWNDWVRTSIAWTEGRDVLEIGHGPGHLQAALLDKGFAAFGLDESRQMGRLARRRLTRLGLAPRLVRADARAMPFPPARFETVVSTFPSEYILQPETLDEIARVLVPGGRLVVLASVTITGRGVVDRALSLLYRVTGESHPIVEDFDPLAVLEAAGLPAEIHWVNQPGSRLLYLVARRADDLHSREEVD